MANGAALRSLTDGAQRLVEGLWRIGGGSWNERTDALSAEADGNVYLLTTGASHVLIDCGTRTGFPAIRANLERLGFDGSQIRDLLLTHSHWDHSEAAAQWQAENDVRTHLNSVGRAFLDRGDHRLLGYQIGPPPHDFDVFDVDHGVDDGETFQLGAIVATAYHLPGHTPDSTLITAEHGGMTFGFCGDIVFHPRQEDGPILGQLCSLWLSNLDHYIDSLQRMLELDIDLLLPGHGNPVCGKRETRLATEQTLRLAEVLAHDRRLRENVGI
jgi:glyoxylase-like metal-dependent hydrolase (beta-lactamase superfamily II)